jgi:hypothetical protein
MREVVANGLTASNKDRAGLSNEESVRFFGPPPLIAGSGTIRGDAGSDFGRRGAAQFPRGNVGQRRRHSLLGDAAVAPA